MIACQSQGKKIEGVGISLPGRFNHDRPTAWSSRPT